MKSDFGYYCIKNYSSFLILDFPKPKPPRKEIMDSKIFTNNSCSFLRKTIKNPRNIKLVINKRECNFVGLSFQHDLAYLAHLSFQLVLKYVQG